MSDLPLDDIEKRERRFLAHVIFIAKVITGISLLILFFALDASLIFKVVTLEFARLF